MQRLIRYSSCLTLLLVGAALAGVPEGEPNDDPTAPSYAGDLGILNETPIVVDGAIASYGVDGDQDFHRFTLTTAMTVSIDVDGFSGQPNIALFDADLVRLAPGFVAGGHGRVPANALEPGIYIAGLGGASGPDNDTYELTIQKQTTAPLVVQTAKVKFNLKKPERDSGKIVAGFTAAGLNPAVDGLFLETLGRQWFLSPGSFKASGNKVTYKGAKGETLKKLQIDRVKGLLKIILKKGDLGVPGFSNEIDLHLESGALGLADTVIGIAKKNGKLLTYKAPR